MNPPPAGATPYLYVADNQPNRGSTGAVFAWSQWQQLVNTAIPQGLSEMFNIQSFGVSP